MLGQLILSLSILIVLHEMGHFFPAKWFNTRVEKFYLFFDPFFSLFKIKRGDTEYGIGWLPLGGYVKISGMIDESMDMEAMKLPPQPWEFRSKPAWQRLIIMLGGVTVNFILGFLIFAIILFKWGEAYLPTANVHDGIYVEEMGESMGLRDGDKILSINGAPFTKFNDRQLMREIVINDAKNMQVIREGKTLDLPIDPKFIGELTASENKDKGLFGPRMPFIIEEASTDNAAGKAGIKSGDKIVAINGQPTNYFHEFKKIIRGKKEQTVKIGVLRDNQPLEFDILTNENAQIGVIPKYPFEMERQNYTLVEAFPAGFKKGMNFLGDQVKAFGQMFKGKIKASESLGGFMSISKMFGYQWDWERFWNMTAVLSLILAFMNLLPIPALDGGHVMFLLWEVITGRKPSDKVLEYSTIVGFVLVLGLLLFANGMDVIRWWNSKG